MVCLSSPTAVLLVFINSSAGSVVCLHTRGGTAAAFTPHACCFAGTPVCPHTLGGPIAVFLLYICSSPGPLLHPPPPPQTHLHHLAAPQLCAHFTYAPSAGPLVCLHPLGGPTAVCPTACPQLPGPARMTNPPLQLTPSRRARSQISTPYTHILQAHSHVHTLSGPAAAFPQWCACSSTGLLARSTSLPPPSQRARGEQDPLELAWGAAYQKRE